MTCSRYDSLQTSGKDTEALIINHCCIYTSSAEAGKLPQVELVMNMQLKRQIYSSFALKFSDELKKIKTSR